MKILFVATVRSHIGQFHMPFINYLTQNGHEVHIACRDNSAEKQGLCLDAVSRMYDVPFERNPLRINNIRAYFQLKRIIRTGSYDIVHCHTPMGGVIARLACIGERKKGLKVLYTAHGFHFYKGAPLKNWLIYYPIEKFLARYTDCLILINQEDYDLALKKKFKAKKIVKIDGVGVELDKFSFALSDSKAKIREKYGYKDEDFILIYPADLSVRKNQKLLFQTVSKLKNQIPQLKLLLPGQPILLEEYKAICNELDITEYVDFLGYRRDIPQLVAMSDISVSSSTQEGLPINIIEAMAIGNPVIATDVRGNRDLIDQGLGGYIVPLNDIDSMADAIMKLYLDGDLRERMGQYNVTKAQDYSCYKIIASMSQIFENI